MAGLNPFPPFTVHHSHPATRQLTHSEAHSLLSNFLDLAQNDPAYRPDSVLTETGPVSSTAAGTQNLTLHHLNRIKLGLEGTRLGVEELEENFFNGSNGRGGPFPTEDAPSSRKRKLADEQTEEASSPPKKKPWQPREEAPRESFKAGALEDGLNGEGAEGGEQPDWQDKDTFELEQDDDDEALDIGNNAQRNPGAVQVQEDEIPVVRDDEDDEVVKTTQADGEMALRDGRKDKKKISGTRIQVEMSPEKPPETPSKVDIEERKRLKKERAKREKRTARA